MLRFSLLLSGHSGPDLPVAVSAQPSTLKFVSFEHSNLHRGQFANVNAKNVMNSPPPVSSYEPITKLDDDDHLDGSVNDDVLLGESGKDTLAGQPGRDRMAGGSGNGADPGDMVITDTHTEIDEFFSFADDWNILVTRRR